ncbi:hypothetical protein [Brevibacillus migulae]|uniref:hypothetical protein n=1 Tax=Brevibacillus migulae TaxID=1644114 RepID=UPI00106DF81A|nr:hypothetical protein [Brevibacillus migulae]
MIPYFLLKALLLLSSIGPEAPMHAIHSAQMSIQEFDLTLYDWRKGKEIQLSHPFFVLKSVRAEPDDTIVFQGESGGMAGTIFVQFYTLSGRLIPVAPEKQRSVHVDKKKRPFEVASVIPVELRGKQGVVQVTFQGEKRAAFLLSVLF